MKHIAYMTLLAVSIICTACQDTACQYPFQNPKLSADERVDNLISLLTVEEKVAMLNSNQPAIERLGIPAFKFGSEACHGICQDDATVFPQAIALAASFDRKQQQDIFSAVSDEARARWNQDQGGLSFWTPNINIVRDPRWGRGQETYGEDPYLTGVMGSAVVRGLQGDDKRYLKAAACAKHFSVHSGPESIRHKDNPSVSDRDLWDTYLPAFRTLVQDAGVEEVMCAYTRFEGKPCCASDRLLTDILRNQWGFKGIVVSDCGAIGDFFEYGHHQTHNDAVDASASAVLSGTNIECGAFGGSNAYAHLLESIEKGLLKEDDIDKVLRGALLLRVKLGCFDPAESLPWKDLGPETVSSDRNHALALKAARESMTLLTNNGILPLKKNVGKILVVGPNADDSEMQLGNYNGRPTAAHTQSIVDAIRAAAPDAEVRYVKGCGHADTEGVSFMIDGSPLHVEYFDNPDFLGKPVGTESMTYINVSPYSTLPECVEGLENYSMRCRTVLSFDQPSSILYTVRSNARYSLKVNGREICSQKENRPDIGYDSVPDMDGKLDVQPGMKYELVLEYSKDFEGASHLYFDAAQQDVCPEEEVEAGDADIVIAVCGLSSRLEAEQTCVYADGFFGGDRTRVELPDVQQRLIRKMHDSGKPVVVVNCSGSAVTYTQVEGNYDALLQAWYAGEAMGQAVADVLFGDYNPAGRLPVTVYASTEQIPDFRDYNMEGRTYRYLRGEEPEFHFGYGLSYTTFEYGSAKLSASSAKAGEDVDITIPVSNTGSMDGDEVVQVYIKSLDDPTAPVKELKGFERVSIVAGQTVNVKITLDGNSFERYDLDQKKVAVHKGRYQILYGGSSRESDLSAIDFSVL